jgi:hypothetical protein
MFVLRVIFSAGRIPASDDRRRYVVVDAVFIEPDRIETQLFSSFSFTQCFFENARLL